MPKVSYLILDTSLVFSSLIFSFLGIIILYYVFKYAEQTYAERNKKPFFKSLVLFNKRLLKSQRLILERQFSFYKILPPKEQIRFNHRVARFIEDKNFVGREKLRITDEIEVLIAATAVMMTFGFRNYKLPIINTILVYPESFYSNQNEQFHKGEVNPQLGVVAFSWKDFNEGFDIENDNLNLGIHEFGHAIHFNSIKNNDISSQIFSDGFKDLKKYLKLNENKRQKLIKTRYFREYAYTNEFEFIAVILECFFETPKEFKASFPKIYDIVKGMLNFNFASY